MAKSHLYIEIYEWKLKTNKQKNKQKGKKCQSYKKITLQSECKKEQATSYTSSLSNGAWSCWELGWVCAYKEPPSAGALSIRSKLLIPLKDYICQKRQITSLCFQFKYKGFCFQAWKHGPEIGPHWVKPPQRIYSVPTHQLA